MKHIKNAPMKNNLKDVFKSALYMVASLMAFTIKLTALIIRKAFAGVKAVAVTK